MEKTAARVTYYEGIRQAALQQFKVTEVGLRKLKGVEAHKIERVVADIQKRQKKLLKRINRQIKEERVRAA